MRKTIKINDKGNNLIKKILNISGDKVITIYCPDSVNQQAVFFISKDGKAENAGLFEAKIYHALKTGGSIIIRQFVDGKNCENLYGIRLNNDEWTGLSKHILRYCYSIDANTGKSISTPVNVNYCDFV